MRQARPSTIEVGGCCGSETQRSVIHNNLLNYKFDSIHTGQRTEVFSVMASASGDATGDLATPTAAAPPAGVEHAAVAAGGSGCAAGSERKGDDVEAPPRPGSPDSGRDTFTFLGTGTSEGVPRVSCLARADLDCDICARAARARSGAPEAEGGCKDRRGNTGAIIRRWNAARGRHDVILLDVGKLWWESAIELFPRLGIDRIDAVVITHGHFDAMGGLDSLRDYTRPPIMEKGQTLRVYTDLETFRVIERTFPYLTDAGKATGGGDVPALTFERFTVGEKFRVEPCDVEMTPYRLQHGPEGDLNYCIGFRIGDMAYASDTNGVPPASRVLFEGARTVVFDCLWLKPEAHASHFGIEQAVEEHAGGYGGGEANKPEQTWLVGMNHTVPHDKTNADLVARGHPDIALAHDGLTIDIKLSP